MIGLLLTIVVIFLVPALPGAACAWAVPQSRLRAAAEVAILLVPFGAWLGLSLIWQEGKSLSNVAVEPFLVGVASSIAAGLRILLSRYVGAAGAGWITFVAMVIVASATWWLMPSLRE